MTFADLGVPANLAGILADRGITIPTPIQQVTLPDSLAGRDVLGRGRTGSGKTYAFLLPVVARLTASRRTTRPGAPRALILAPTRELVGQIEQALKPLASANGLTTMTIFGGVGQGPQVNSLKRGADIVLACPGRLEDLIKQRHCSLGDVEVTVLDEADHMADLGFLPAVKRLLDQTPSGTQRLLFSATLDNGVDVIVKRYMTNPVVHSVDPVTAPVSTMIHHVLSVSVVDKPAVIRQLAAGQQRSLLFTRTKHGAKKLAKQLTAAGIPAVELHGNLSQNARERNLQSFSEGTTRVLVATDIAARGIHVDEIGLVVHVDPPAEHKAYLHRSGRTARAGAEGVVVTLATPDQAGDVRSLARAAGIAPTVTAVGPGHARLAELAGELAKHVEPSREARAAALDRPRHPRPQGRPASSGRTSGQPRTGQSRGGGQGRPAGQGRPGTRSRSRYG